MTFRGVLAVVLLGAAFTLACGSKPADSGPNAKPADNADLCRELVAWEKETMPAFGKALNGLSETSTPAEIKKVWVPAMVAFTKPFREMEKRAPRDLQLELQDALKRLDATTALMEKANYDQSKMDEAAFEGLDTTDSGTGIGLWRAKNCLR